VPPPRINRLLIHGGNSRYKFSRHLEREKTRNRVGDAHTFLQANPNEVLLITFTIAAEIACGATLARRLDWERFCEPFIILNYSIEVGWQYGELYRFLSTQGKLIGTNDLWIAATALVHTLPIVTRNTSEFARIPNLQVLKY
jgi:predicted nucleic acid-binding protein